MPKLIDYPRTTYTTAWELAEVIDDTGGKCAIETAARKLNRKVSGSFKAIIGSGVKFGLMTSKRDLLTTTTLFKRIKHAYDKQEEILFHREAFLAPPLFTQICRKFRSRELPVQMLDVMLIREFSVEEINAQAVAKAFINGCRMVGLLDENNIIADIDALATQQSPRRELANNRTTINSFRQEIANLDTTQEPALFQGIPVDRRTRNSENEQYEEPMTSTNATDAINSIPTTIRTASSITAPNNEPDAITNLFGLSGAYQNESKENTRTQPNWTVQNEHPRVQYQEKNQVAIGQQPPSGGTSEATIYQIQVSGPGVNTTLSIIEEEDITLAIALLEKIRRQLRA